MKLIENSVEGENLQTDGIEGEMASCEIVQLNGQQSKEESSSNEVIMEKVVQLSNLSNGIGEKIKSPKKSTSNSNGYYDDISDDDYHLVLESSSDESGSPIKKIDEDTISAPQIVQEIENLLGINASSAAIDDELEKDLDVNNIDSCESIDINEKEVDDLVEIDNTRSIPQEIQDVFEDRTEETCNKVEGIYSLEKEKKEESKEEQNNLPECDSSSNMNVVFHEVEIGSDNIEIEETVSDAVSSTQKLAKVMNEASDLKQSVMDDLQLSETDCKERSIGENNIINDVPVCKNIVTPEELDKQNKNQVKLINDKTETIMEVEAESGADKTKERINDAPLSQNKNLSQSLEESTVSDAVELTENEENQIKTDKFDILESDQLRKPSIINETNENVSINFESKDVTVDSKNEDNADNNKIKSIIGLVDTKTDEDMIDSKTETAIMDFEAEGRTVDSTMELIAPDSKTENIDSKTRLGDDAVTTSSTPISEGEGIRKRTSVDEDNVNHKKPKLKKEENALIENTLNILKRPSLETIENESKKIKLCNIPHLEPITNNSNKNILSESCIDKDVAEKKSEKKSGDQFKHEKSVEENNFDSCVNSSKRLTNEHSQTKKNNGGIMSNEIAKEDNDHTNLIGYEQIKTETSNNHVETASTTVVPAKSLADDKIEAGTSDLLKSEQDSVKLKTDDSLVKQTQSNEINSASKKSIISLDDNYNKKSDKSSPSVTKVSTSTTDLEENCIKNNNNFSCDKPVENISLECNNSKEVSLKNKTNANKENVEVCGISSSSSTEGSNSKVVLKPVSHSEFYSTTDTERSSADSKKKFKLKCESILVKNIFNSSKTEIVGEKIPKIIQNDLDKKLKPDKIKEAEKSNKTIHKSKEQVFKKIISPFDLLSKNMQKRKIEPKISNLDKAIESVVKKARAESERMLPALKKFHKDQLKKLTRSELEEIIVTKICEAVSDRSDIGQMRLRCQTLEENNEIWRKKAAQFEKQNRELEMVLKRYLTETAQMKREKQNKLVLPIKVTRSVGLQVVLASSVHGALVSSKHTIIPEVLQSDTKKISSQQQPHQKKQQESQQQKPADQDVSFKKAEKEPTKETVRTSTFTPPVQSSAGSTTFRGRGRSGKLPQTSTPSTSSAPSISLPSSPKSTPPSTPVKSTTVPTKIVTPNKDLEVIDLTEKEEKTKSPVQSSAGGSVRVAPSTQICYVQPTSGSTATPQMAYFVQKRPQFVVTTSSASPPRPSVSSSHRSPPALALPVIRTGNQIIPVQPQVAVRSTSSIVTQQQTPSARQMPQAIRLQTHNNKGFKHPAPLPPCPTPPLKPGCKLLPPKPQLKIAKTVNGIMLSWSMTLNKDIAEMASYQLYAYQEGSQLPSTSLWKKVGDVKALPLPMACTLTQFIDGHKYHFAVRAVDVHGRIGPYSQPCSILLAD